MIYVLDRDRCGYQKSSRAELEAAIADSGYPYDISDSPLSEVKSIADSRGLDYFCWLSYEPENKAAKALYNSFGFVENGETDGEEIVAVLKL